MQHAAYEIIAAAGRVAPAFGVGTQVVADGVRDRHRLRNQWREEASIRKEMNGFRSVREGARLDAMGGEEPAGLIDIVCAADSEDFFSIGDEQIDEPQVFVGPRQRPATARVGLLVIKIVNCAHDVQATATPPFFQQFGQTCVETRDQGRGTEEQDFRVKERLR